MFLPIFRSSKQNFGAGWKPALRSAILGGIRFATNGLAMVLALLIVGAFPIASMSDDSGANPSSTPLTGGVSAYATEESSAPLMQGKACDSLPSQWQGTWQGTIGQNHQRLSRETATADARNPHLAGEGAKVSVNLVATTGGSNIAELEVVDNHRAREGDPNPDIIFFHNGDKGHLLILLGARMHTHTQNGDVYIGGNGTELIGDHVMIGNSINTGPGLSNQRQINYNSGGIQINGPTVFNDRYFKADERIHVNDGTQINAGRVDIGPAKMYPGGQSIDITGSANDGFRISRPSADPSAAQPNTITSMPYDMLNKAHPANTTTVMVAPGVFDQRSLSPIQNPDGTISGYREMVARYTALSADTMFVQISVGSPGQNSTPDFSASGYLKKKQP
jgi:hypothetical protein